MMSQPPSKPTPDPQEEARKFERHAVTIPVDVTIVLNGARSTHRGQASDISRGGMRLFLPRELGSGTSLILEFLIPYNTTQIVVRGVVRNRNGFSHGVEFIDSTPDQQQMIERTCSIFKLLR